MKKIIGLIGCGCLLLVVIAGFALAVFFYIAPMYEDTVPIQPRPASPRTHTEITFDQAALNAANPGEELDINDYIEPGKITIFDFYSEFCPPCRTLSPKLTELDSLRDDVVVYKLDINRSGVSGIDWSSPLAQQYGLNSIPKLVAFDENGEPMDTGSNASAFVRGLMP